MRQQYANIERNRNPSLQYSRIEEDKQTIYSTPETNKSYAKPRTRTPPRSRHQERYNQDVESITTDSDERYQRDESEEKQDEVEISESLDGFNSISGDRSLMKQSISLSLAPTLDRKRESVSVSLNESHTSTDDAMASQTEPSLEITIQTKETQTPSPKSDEYTSLDLFVP